MLLWYVICNYIWHMGNQNYELVLLIRKYSRKRQKSNIFDKEKCSFRSSPTFCLIEVLYILLWSCSFYNSFIFFMVFPCHRSFLTSLCFSLEKYFHLIYVFRREGNLTRSTTEVLYSSTYYCAQPYFLSLVHNASTEGHFRFTVFPSKMLKYVYLRQLQEAMTIGLYYRNVTRKFIR